MDGKRYNLQFVRLKRFILLTEWRAIVIPDIDLRQRILPETFLKEEHLVILKEATEEP